MRLGETIATYDVALALRGESGKFDVTSPTGELYQVTCTPNHSITNLQCSGNGASSQPFLIRKVAEPVPAVVESVATDLTHVATTSGVLKSPFLISASDDDLICDEISTAANISETAEPTLEEREIATLNLVYVEMDPKTQQPSASVCMGDSAEQPRVPITSACMTFNELDAEIRRVHAQLDAIRHQARKRFYDAHTMAAGA